MQKVHQRSRRVASLYKRRCVALVYVIWGSSGEREVGAWFGRAVEEGRGDAKHAALISFRSIGEQTKLFEEMELLGSLGGVGELYDAGAVGGETRA
jgi:hypothetical protein